MALAEMTFRSQALNMDTSFFAVIPETEPYEDIPTLYLLHGMHGNHSSWDRKTAIERYAADRRIAVIMPDGENSFYHDMKYGKKYYTYVSRELVDYTRRVFRLSDKREKTFIAGLSMGGYGALRLALMNPVQYAAAASLSGCVDIAESLSRCAWSNEAAAIWGDDFRQCARDTSSDNLWLIRNFPEDAPKPRIYCACGRQDGLFRQHESFRAFMEDEGRKKGFDFLFEEGDGIHNWLFWDKWIVPALDYMMGIK